MTTARHSSDRRAGRGADRGAVSVHAVSVGIVLLLVAVLLLEVGAAITARHRAAAAADLTALAASRAADQGEEGCAVGRDVARRNGAQLIECRMDAAVATVTVRAVTDRWWGRRWAAEERARAAPVTYTVR